MSQDSTKETEPVVCVYIRVYREEGGEVGKRRRERGKELVYSTVGA